VGDTVQQRQETLRPPQGAVPTPPPGPQVAQAQPSVFPPVSSDAPKAIIPGGGLPQQIPAAPPQIPAAPPDPRSQVQKAPEAPAAPAPMAKPPPPVLEPLDNDRTRHFQRQAADPRLPPLARQAAHEQMKTEQEQIKAYNAQRVNEYGVYMKQYVEEQAKRRDPATVYSTEKARRELEGEGATPLTPEQRKQFGIPEAQPAYMTRRGEVKFGPAGQTINVDTKAGVKGDEELQKKMSEHIIKTFEAGDAAGDEIKQLADMRALAARVGTGPGAVIKQALGKWGVKTEGLSEIQALEAGINRLIPAQRVPGSGTTSDFDAGMFKESIVGLSKTPQGNNLIFDTMEGLAKNKLDRAEVAGKVIAGDMTRAEAAKDLLGLQRQARDLSDKVKAHLEATGQLKTVDPATPKVVSDDVMRDFLKNNPNHPRAPEIRRQLGM